MLVNNIGQFQGLKILWREINKYVKPKYQLVNKMVEQIEDTIFSGAYEIIKNWEITKNTFCNASSTMRDQKFSKITSQTKIAIGDEINSLLLGKGSNKRRATGNVKTQRAFKLSGQEDEKRYEDSIPFKVWKMLTKDA